MGTSLRLSKLDEKMHGLNNEPVFIDSIDTTKLEGKQIENSFLYAKYTDGVIDISMSCECGQLTTNRYYGKRCNYCNTVVQSRVERLLEARLWYRKPDRLLKLFNPIAWIMLCTNLSVGNFNIVAWICDRSRPLEIKNESTGRYIESLPFERGYNNFITNFDEIMEALNVPKVITAKNRRAQFKVWLDLYREDIFTDNIPLPNREFVVMEQTGNARFAQSTNVSAVDAIRTIKEMNNSIMVMSDTRIEKRIVRFYEQMTDYFNSTLSKFIGTKYGIMRKHVYGDILAWTCRCVISSITGPHLYNEVILPWGAALRLFKIHLSGRMRYDHGMSPKQIEDRLSGAVTYIDPLISDLLDQIIASAYGGYIHLILGRNPTIYKGNILRVLCNKIKRDLTDTTIGLPILIARPLNADFDGDEVNVTLSPDNKFSRAIDAFGPHTVVMEESKCWEVSRNIALSEPLTANTNTYLIARGQPQA